MFTIHKECLDRLAQTSIYHKEPSVKIHETLSLPSDTLPCDLSSAIEVIACVAAGDIQPSIMAISDMSVITLSRPPSPAPATCSATCAQAPRSSRSAKEVYRGGLALLRPAAVARSGGSRRRSKLLQGLKRCDGMGDRTSCELSSVRAAYAAAIRQAYR